MFLRILWLWVFTWLVRTTRGLQGDSYCNPTMCIRAFVNGTQTTCESCIAPGRLWCCRAKQLAVNQCTEADSNYIDQMQANLGEKQFGWMAVGFGTTMIDADMIIMWPNQDGSVTLSQRASRNHAQPTIVDNPARVATKYLQLSSQTANQTTLAFTVPASTQTIERLIWAVSTLRPSSANADAGLLQHAASGAISLDLSRTFSDDIEGIVAPTGHPPLQVNGPM
ncbi:hypothetical protein M408DRAFT_6228 [Serendipita vermifera MAFF 305830]|uniref:DOMON domain-containing protein n=1 Tax=Serendipita vermifera MAFF 305830 TaxID=933852 RepID=A0A0C2X3J3_SERVB|nr:hypothetical protein M408DRAFT_6228 [Serendipita vermifera MAFF 305830]